MFYYEHLGKYEGVCSGDVVIKGTRIRPSDIVNYGTIEEIMDDFGLTRDQVIEACHYAMNSNADDDSCVALNTKPGKYIQAIDVSNKSRVK